MGQFQITGHSGTDFKNRRAFTNLKALRRKSLKRRTQSHVDDDLVAYRSVNPYVSIDKTSRAVKILAFMPFCILLLLVAYYFSQDLFAGTISSFIDILT